MRHILTLCFLVCGTLAQGQEIAARARQLEEKGQAGAARSLLLSAAREAPNDTVTLTVAAEFLDRHGDPAARQAYERLLTLLEKSGSREAGKYARRLVALDLLAGDTAAARAHARLAGGVGIPAPKAELAEYTMIEIPGPLRSFSRMAALSPDLPREEILPALARNVVTNGYQAANSNEGLEPTEYLKLVVRYLSQAAHGQMKMLSAGRPIDAVLRDPTVPVRTRMLLAEIPAIRAYGAAYGLNTKHNYKSYIELEGIEGLHFHSLCGKGADTLERTIDVIEQNFGEFLPRMKWVNFGGGHHITKASYDIERLINSLKKKAASFGLTLVPLQEVH